MIDPATRATVQARVLRWWDGNRRDLPWRRTRDPYQILVSEVMLQQTQVDRVAPKFIEFIHAFPTVHALAEATPGDVIRRWSGLGYNRRAVRLHHLARAVVGQHGGEIPNDPAALRRLEGVGQYTAAAVASIAFGADVPAVDANVRRVLGRLAWGDGAMTSGDLARLAFDLVPRGRACDWNQALMDLGAMVCRSRLPLCERCPIADDCRRAADASMPRMAEARAAYRAKPFKDSNRYYRGRTLARLRRLGPGQDLSLESLSQELRPSLEDGGAWIRALVAGLERDGLVVLGDDGRSVALPA